jgi:predicted SnoaL-like aldol condensation-catalyzing enzyme
MTYIKSTLVAIAFAFSAYVAPATAQQSNKDFVINAVTELFSNKDLTAIDRYWADGYIQHNPHLASTSAVLKAALKDMPKDMTYEIGMVIAEGDLVAIHGRYTGWGPKPLIVVDIYRVENGKIAEHWDVGQEEVLETASGNPMFEPRK